MFVYMFVCMYVPMYVCPMHACMHAIAPSLFPRPKKVRGCQILNIVIVVRLAIKNLEGSDCLVVVNIKNLTFYFYILKL